MDKNNNVSREIFVQKKAQLTIVNRSKYIKVMKDSTVIHEDKNMKKKGLYVIVLDSMNAVVMDSNWFDCQQLLSYILIELLLLHLW